MLSQYKIVVKLIVVTEHNTKLLYYCIVLYVDQYNDVTKLTILMSHVTCKSYY